MARLAFHEYCVQGHLHYPNVFCIQVYPPWPPATSPNTSFLKSNCLLFLVPDKVPTTE